MTDYPRFQPDEVALAASVDYNAVVKHVRGRTDWTTTGSISAGNITGSNISASGNVYISGSLTVDGTSSSNVASHSGSHANGGTDEVYLDASQITSGQFSETILTDAGISSIRTHAPSGHSGSHTSGSGDQVTIYKNQITDLNTSFTTPTSISITGSISGSEIQGSSVNSPYFSGSNISGSSYTGGSLTVENITGSTLISGSVFRGPSAIITSITGTTINGTTITGTTITGSTYQGGIVSGFAKSGSSTLRNTVYLQEGTGITLTQSGQYIEIISSATGSGTGSAGVPSNTVTIETAFAQASAGGSASTYSRGDHTHGTPTLTTTTPADIAGTASAGSVNAANKRDHIHRGLLTVRETGSANMYGSVDLVGSSNIIVTQGTQALTFSLPSTISVTGVTATGTITGSLLQSTNCNPTNVTATNITGSRIIGTDITGSNIYALWMYPDYLTASNEINTGTINSEDGIFTGYLSGSAISGSIKQDMDGNARIGVRKSSGTTYKRRRINFIEGANVTLTVGDDAGSEEVDVTIAASAGTGEPNRQEKYLIFQDTGIWYARNGNTGEYDSSNADVDVVLEYAMANSGGGGTGSSVPQDVIRIKGEV